MNYCATFFKMMVDSLFYESEYFKFHWYIGGVQGVIPVVPHIQAVSHSLLVRADIHRLPVVLDPRDWR